MERETQQLINHFVFKGRKLKEPDDTRLTASRCSLANIPRKNWSSVWKYYPDDFRPKRILLRYVEELDKHRKDGKGLLLSGRTREGKTNAAILVAKEIIRRDGFPYFLPCSHIPNIEMGKDPEDVELSSKIRNITFLILDDLGADSGKEKVASMIEQIVRDRDAQMLPTIITTNLNMTGMEKQFGLPFTALVEEICIKVPFLCKDSSDSSDS